jgi:hypothetical protein
MRRRKPQPRWLPSGRAAEALGVGKTTLRRYAQQGLLAEGEHYRRGLTPTSPWRWEVTGINQLMEKLTTLPIRPRED